MGLLEDVIGGVLKTGTGGQAKSGGGMSPMVMAALAYFAYRALSGQAGGAPQPSPGGRRGAPDPDTPPGGGGLGDILGDILGGGAGGGPSGGGRMPKPGGQGGGLGDILGDILGGGAAGGGRGGSPGGGRAPMPGGQGGGGLGDILGEILGGGRGGAQAGGAGHGGGRRSSGLDELSDIVDRFDKNGQGGVAQSWVGRGDNEPISPDQMSTVLDADTIEQLQAATGIDRDELLAGLAQTLPVVVDQLTPEGRLPTPQEWQRFER